MAKEGGIQMGIIYGIEELGQRNEKYEVIKKDVVETADVCIIGFGARWCRPC